MFKVIGADGKEYGPVTVDQLRQWIQAGRAGGHTQVQREGAEGWDPLNSMPEFADLFRPPVTATLRGGLPPVVRTFGILTIAVGVMSLLRQSTTLFGLVTAMSHGADLSHLTGSFYAFLALGVLEVIARIVSGLGLLRGREWARQLAVYYAALAALLGLYGLGRTFSWMSGSSSGVTWGASPSFLFSIGFSVVLLGFNIATIVLLGRRGVREALSAKSSSAV